MSHNPEKMENPSESTGKTVDLLREGGFAKDLSPADQRNYERAKRAFDTFIGGEESYMSAGDSTSWADKISDPDARQALSRAMLSKLNESAAGEEGYFRKQLIAELGKRVGEMEKAPDADITELEETPQDNHTALLEENQKTGELLEGEKDQLNKVRESLELGPEENPDTLAIRSLQEKKQEIEAKLGDKGETESKSFPETKDNSKESLKEDVAALKNDVGILSDIFSEVADELRRRDREDYQSIGKARLFTDAAEQMQRFSTDSKDNPDDAADALKNFNNVAESSVKALQSIGLGEHRGATIEDMRSLSRLQEKFDSIIPSIGKMQNLADNSKHKEISSLSPDFGKIKRQLGKSADFIDLLKSRTKRYL